MTSVKQTPMFTDVMIDIESASTEPNALILSIGLVKFNMFTGCSSNLSCEILIDVSEFFEFTQDENHTQTTISYKTGTSSPYHIARDTITWWNTQSNQTRQHTFCNGQRVNISDALHQINTFCSTDETTKIERFWAQGINFDPVVLEFAFKQNSIKPCWSYYQWRDSRTVSSLVPRYIWPKRNSLEAHDALSDCHYQIQVLLASLASLKMKPSSTLTITPKPGDWKCVCGANNFAYRTTCFKCNSRK